MTDILDDYIDKYDVLKLMEITNETTTPGTYGLAAIGLLDKSPHEKRTASAEEIKTLEKQTLEIMNDYGRGITQTLLDEVINTYTPKFIIKAVRKMMKACCDKYILIPDYAPTDGRLHFHGIANFKTIKNQAKFKKLSKPFGWTKIDLEPKVTLPEYMFKIYEKNKYTPKNTRIENLPLEDIIANV